MDELANKVEKSQGLELLADVCCQSTNQMCNLVVFRHFYDMTGQAMTHHKIMLTHRIDLGGDDGGRNVKEIEHESTSQQQV